MALVNRSLERGLAVLGCFKPGVDLMSHRDWCEQTGLPKATVTRLVRTLCESGFLVADRARGGYALGPPILSLARAMVLDHPLLRIVSPLVREIAERTRAMVGFGTAHDEDIVYLDGANLDETRPTRRIGQGTRIPIVNSSIGHAWLAGLSGAQRTRKLAALKAATHWTRQTQRAIDASLHQIEAMGYCAVAYNEGQHVAVGMPVVLADGVVYAANIAYPVGRFRTVGVPPQITVALAQLTSAIARSGTGTDLG